MIGKLGISSLVPFLVRSYSIRHNRCSWFGFIVMVVGSSSNWYACHWYMGAYFTRLADLRSLRVCYLTLLSPSFFSFPLVRASFLLTISLLLPFFLPSSFSCSFSFLSFFSRARPAGDRATNMSGELCLPFVKILDVSLIGTSGGRVTLNGEKSRQAYTKIRGTFDHGIQPSRHNDHGWTKFTF